MSADDLQGPDHPRPTLFLSYAREDRDAVLLIRDALPRFGLEVWYDESELLGGDAWDQKIRRQIRECDFFMPVISAQTEARREGYFRREWRLGAERTLDMADDSVFLVPVVLDQTGEADARVPDRFRAVQWTRVPGGQPNAALEALCRRLVSREPHAPPAHSAGKPRGTRRRPPPARSAFPEFPRQEPGQTVRFWAQVAGWVLQSAWAAFRRVPRWVRVLVYIWLAILILQWSFSSHTQVGPPSAGTGKLSAAQTKNLAQLARITRDLRGGSANTPTAKVLKHIARSAKPVPAVATTTNARAPVLAIPFTAPQGEPAARKFADTVFEKVFGQLVLARRGHVALSVTALPSLDSAAAVKQGRAHHARYILCGGIRGRAPKLTLTVEILDVADGSVAWSKSYAVAGADPTRIASQAVSEVPTTGTG